MARTRTTTHKRKNISKSSYIRREKFWKQKCQDKEIRHKEQLLEIKRNRDIFWMNKSAVEQEKLEEEIKEIRKQKERAKKKCKEALVGWQATCNALKRREERFLELNKEKEIEFQKEVRRVQEEFKVRLEEREAEYEQIIQGLQKERDLIILEEQMAKVSLKNAQGEIENLKKG